MYLRIKKYCDLIPDYQLYFSLAKYKYGWMFIYPKFWRDILQIIALCILENNNLKNRNLAIGRELYKFARHVLDLPLRKKLNIKYKTKCKNINKCWICKKEKKEYMRVSLTPGHKICNACYSKLRREKKRRIYMHPVELIANAIKDYHEIEIPKKTELDICCVTGEKCQTISRKEVLSSNFTNYDILKSPESDRIGIAATMSLKYRPERSSWFVNEKEFIRFDKNLFRDMFLNGVKKSKYWAIYITTSYKKHGALVTKINSCSNGNIRKYGYWRFEQLNVDASDGQKNKFWYNKISEAMENGIGRTIIESLECPPFLIKKIGISKWIEFEKWARNKYQSPLYKLCCYLLPSQKELKLEK